jgi:hypothetical protein
MCAPKIISRDPNHKPSTKYGLMVYELTESLRKRDGPEKMRILEGQLKAVVQEGMRRETVCQILAKETGRRRRLVLLFHPGLIVPYLMRVKKLN